MVEHAACPRCGYDLRGIVISWRDSCPLNGACAECGLEFGWHEILRVDRQLPRWCIEFACPPRSLAAGEPVSLRVPGLGLVIAAIKTWARSMWPWGFWKRMKMSFPIRWRRLIAYLFLLVLLPTITLYVGGRGALAVYARWQWQNSLANYAAQLQKQITVIQTTPYRSSRPWPSLLPSLNLETRLQFEQNRTSAIASMQATIASPPYIEHSYFVAIYEAVCTPLAKQSLGTVQFGSAAATWGRSQPYPTAPANLLEHAIEQPWSSIGATSRYGYFGVDVLQTVGIAALCTELLVLFPLSLALLPVTRRRAKVRWGHIGRVAMYSAFIPITTVCIVIVLVPVAALRNTLGGNIANLAMFSPALLIPLLGALWWWAAIKHYLKMPHALAVTLVLGALCVLMCMMLTGIIAGGLFG